MWSYKASVPDVPPFEQRRWATVDERGWEADWFAMPTLAGTYLETGKHLDPSVIPIDQVPIERLFCNAVIATVPKAAGEHITAAELEPYGDLITPGGALLVSTGWDRLWSDQTGSFVMDSPHFDREAMAWIVEHGVGILGGDMPCFDDPQPGGGQDVNTVLFGSGALILAPLVGLGDWDGPMARLTVLPIPLKDACGSPCRAILSQV